MLYAHVDVHGCTSVGFTGQLWGINLLLWAGLTQQALLPDEPSCWPAVSPYFIANNSEEAFIGQKFILVLKVKKEPS